LTMNIAADRMRRPRHAPEMPTDLEGLSEDECWQLLAQHHLGRMAVVVDGQPMIFPVNYGLSHRIVTFRTAHGTKLSYAPGSDVSFGIGDYAPTTRVGGASSWLSMPPRRSTTSHGQPAEPHRIRSHPA
jgi:hypothetical protein